MTTSLRVVASKENFTDKGDGKDAKGAACLHWRNVARKTEALKKQ